VLEKKRKERKKGRIIRDLTQNAKVDTMGTVDDGDGGRQRSKRLRESAGRQAESIRRTVNRRGSKGGEESSDDDSDGYTAVASEIYDRFVDTDSPDAEVRTYSSRKYTWEARNVKLKVPIGPLKPGILVRKIGFNLDDARVTVIVDRPKGRALRFQRLIFLDVMTDNEDSDGYMPGEREREEIEGDRPGDADGDDV